MATRQMVSTKLSALAVVYRPDCGAAQMRVLVDEYTPVFANMTDMEFLAAVEEVKRTSRFFPTPADILAAHDHLGRQPKITSAALPHKPTPDEFAHQAAMSRRLLKRLEVNKMVRQ